MRKRIFRQAFIPALLETAAPFVETFLEEQGVEVAGNMAKGFINKLKGVAGDVEKKSQAPSKGGELEREKVFKDLANTFKALGVKAPYNNAEQLFLMFGEEMPGLFKDSDNYLKLLETLKSFLNASSGLVDRDPDLPTDAVKYMFSLLQKSAFDTVYAEQKINELADKATDPFSDGYVISILKGNYSLASVFLMMQSFTENKTFNSSLFKDMKSLQDQANTILGPLSAELANATLLQTEIGKANFQKIVKDRNVYQALVPTAIEVQQIRSNIEKTFGNFYNSPAFKSLLNDPTVKTIIFGVNGFKQGISGISSPSFGETFGKGA